jgi:hypothetical protein
MTFRLLRVFLMMECVSIFSHGGGAQMRVTFDA